jgi:uncharacterized membrane protein YcaP (DUF421 family)
LVLFHSWFGLLRVLVVGTLAYAGLVVFVRISGKRTLSKMNAFDFVVTVAMGSTLAGRRTRRRRATTSSSFRTETRSTTSR